MKIKLVSSGEEINEIDFTKSLHQIYWILNSVIDGNKAQLFGSKKYIGWCNQPSQVADSKLVLHTLESMYSQLKKKNKPKYNNKRKDYYLKKENKKQ